MKKNKWILVAALLASPMIAGADEAPADAKPSFSLDGTRLREIIRATAASQYGEFRPAAELDAPPPATAPRIQLPSATLPADEPRAFDHFDCDANECVARDQHHDVMYRVPAERGVYADARTQAAIPVANAEEALLACRLHDDAITPQERRERCNVVAEDNGMSLGEDLVSTIEGGLIDLLIDAILE